MDFNQPISIKIEQPDNIIIDLTGDDEMGDDPQPWTVTTCRICLDMAEVPVATMCGHIFCFNCLTRALEVCGSCPVCRQSSGFIRLYW